jgi:hypothetical protein
LLIVRCLVVSEKKWLKSKGSGFSFSAAADELATDAVEDSILARDRQRNRLCC